MNTVNHEQQLAEQTQQLQRQYGVNALLPEIHWDRLFQNSKLKLPHLQALNTLYQTAVPLALQVFEELNFDVFRPAAYQPQGLGLFNKLCSTGGAITGCFGTRSARLRSKHPPAYLEYVITWWCGTGL